MSNNSESRQPLFTVTNHHTEQCGLPPFYNGDDEKAYIGYFTNSHGEQSIFHYDYESRRATLRMGDAGWAKEFVIVDGKPDSGILDPAEQLWVNACWEAATGGRPA